MSARTSKTPATAGLNAIHTIIEIGEQLCQANDISHGTTLGNRYVFHTSYTVSMPIVIGTRTMGQQALIWLATSQQGNASLCYTTNKEMLDPQNQKLLFLHEICDGMFPLSDEMTNKDRKTMARLIAAEIKQKNALS